METKSLWGGIGKIQLPLHKSFFDISSIRPVPDNQEVFLSSSDLLHEGDSLIIELLEYSNLDSFEESNIPLYFWNDLVNENESIYNKVYHVEYCQSIPPNDFHAFHESLKKYSPELDIQYYSISGFQIVKSKDNNNSLNILLLFLGIIRIQSIKTDIMLSYYSPNKTVSINTDHKLFESYNFLTDIQKTEHSVKSIFKTFVIDEWDEFIGITN